ncbi:MAG: hypothetical protein HY548_05255 [Elusimicrobia bacterium]|nr:hypothetical protein [Elusimicrobiota bacterium]
MFKYKPILDEMTKDLTKRQRDEFSYYFYEALSEIIDKATVAQAAKEGIVRVKMYYEEKPEVSAVQNKPEVAAFKEPERKETAEIGNGPVVEKK